MVFGIAESRWTSNNVLNQLVFVCVFHLHVRQWTNRRMKEQKQGEIKHCVLFSWFSFHLLCSLVHFASCGRFLLEFSDFIRTVSLSRFCGINFIQSENEIHFICSGVYLLCVVRHCIRSAMVILISIFQHKHNAHCTANIFDISSILRLCMVHCNLTHISFTFRTQLLFI